MKLRPLGPTSAEAFTEGASSRLEDGNQPETRARRGLRESGGERRRQGGPWAQRCQGAGWGSPLIGEAGIRPELGIHGNPERRVMRGRPEAGRRETAERGHALRDVPSGEQLPPCAPRLYKGEMNPYVAGCGEN